MARSSYIYLVKGSGNVGNYNPLAAFTVKHELVTWLKKRFPGGVGLNGVEGWRMPDGDPGGRPEQTEIDLKELIK